MGEALLTQINLIQLVCATDDGILARFNSTGFPITN